MIRVNTSRIGSCYRQKMTKQVKLTICFIQEHLPLPCLKIIHVVDRSAKVISSQNWIKIDLFPDPT